MVAGRKSDKIYSSCRLKKNSVLYDLFQFVEENLGVMSVGFLLSSPDDAVIWRGPKKNGEKICVAI